MMFATYRLRPTLFKAINVTSINSQAGDIAELISATSFSVDSVEGSAAFKVADKDEPIKVSTGQVITLCNGAMTIYALADFTANFEPYDAPNQVIDA